MRRSERVIDNKRDVLGWKLKLAVSVILQVISKRGRIEANGDEPRGQRVIAVKRRREFARDNNRNLCIRIFQCEFEL